LSIRRLPVQIRSASLVVVVAQLVERRVVVSGVVGSNPIDHPCSGDEVKRAAYNAFARLRRCKQLKEKTSQKHLS
jgi:hypothetical protein